MNQGRLQKYGWMLVAILGGNALYFALYGFLPISLRHAPFRLDFGLLLDFLLCVSIWVLILRLRNGRYSH